MPPQPFNPNALPFSEYEQALLKGMVRAGYSSQRCADMINHLTGLHRTQLTILKWCKKLGLTCRGRSGRRHNDTAKPRTPVFLKDCPFDGCNWCGKEEDYYGHWRSKHRTRAGNGATGPGMRIT